MSTPRYTLRHAAGSDAGLVRPTQQDAVHASDRLLAVGDGFGGAGAAASAAVLAALHEALPGAGPDDARTGPAADGVEQLREAATAAGAAVEAAVGSADPTVDGTPTSGTTLTALVRTADGLGVVHVGDSRAYLLRDGGLFRLTRDDSLVQDMVDAGRVTPEEAWSHPQRPMLTKVVGLRGVEPDVRLRDVQDGDRYLVCTDGLSAVVPEARIRTALDGAADPQSAVDALLAAVLDAGAPDNVGVVVADLVAAEPVAEDRAAGAAGGRASGGAGLRHRL